MTTTARGTARARYEVSRARHQQGATAVAPAPVAAPMAPPSTPWGRVAAAASEAGWAVRCIRSDDGRRIVAAQRGQATLTMVWDAAQNVLSQSWGAAAPDYAKRPILTETEALRALE